MTTNTDIFFYFPWPITKKKHVFLDLSWPTPDSKKEICSLTNSIDRSLPASVESKKKKRKFLIPIFLALATKISTYSGRSREERTPMPRISREHCRRLRRSGNRIRTSNRERSLSR